MRGEVTVRVRCLMPEKLIDRATAKGARFADVRLTEDSALVVHCDAQSARLLLDLCRRFNLEARVIRLRGFSALRRFSARSARLSSLRISICWGQCFSHLPHPLHWPAKAGGSRSAMAWK